MASFRVCFDGLGLPNTLGYVSLGNGVGADNIKITFNKTETIVSNNATSVETTTTLPAMTDRTPHILSMIKTKKEKIDFYIDGVLVATHTTNIPAVTGAIGFRASLVKSSSSGNDTSSVYVAAATIETL